MEHLRQLQDDGGGSKGKCSNFSFLFFYRRLCLAYSVLIYIYKWLGRRGGLWFLYDSYSTYIKILQFFRGEVCFLLGDVL